jgi:hypothetical protein
MNGTVLKTFTSKVPANERLELKKLAVQPKR